MRVPVLASLPAPNLPGITNNYESAPADTIYNDKGDFRYDYFVGPRLTLFARYSQFDTRIFSPPSIPGPAGGNANGNVFVKTKQGVVGGTWTISPTSILEARLGNRLHAWRQDAIYAGIDVTPPLRFRANRPMPHSPAACSRWV